MGRAVKTYAILTRMLFALAIGMAGLAVETSARGQTPTDRSQSPSDTKAEGRTLRIFVLTGQSNCLGTPATTETNMRPPKVDAQVADRKVPFFWDNTANDTPAGDAALGDSGGRWTNICVQTGGYYPHSADHWGPEVGCARMLWDAGCRGFAIVKSSRGGGGNSVWCKTNSADHFMYDKVVNTVRNATRALPAGYTGFRIVCLLYLQGESDNRYEASIADARFLLLMTNLQHDLPNATGMKAVLGEIAGDKSGIRLLVSQKQFTLAASRPDIGYAPSTGLALQDVDGLNLHYDADSLIIMGERMGQAALQVGALPEAVLPAQKKLFVWSVGDSGFRPPLRSAPELMVGPSNSTQPATDADAGRLIFPVWSNNTHTVQYRDSLRSDSWQRFTDVAATPTGTWAQIPSASANSARFFRIQTPQLP